MPAKCTGSETVPSAPLWYTLLSERQYYLQSFQPYYDIQATLEAFEATKKKLDAGDYKVEAIIRYGRSIRTGTHLASNMLHRDFFNLFTSEKICVLVGTDYYVLISSPMSLVDGKVSSSKD